MRVQVPYVMCLLAPDPYFHVFFRALDIVHHLLLADGLLASPAQTSAQTTAPPPPPDALPTDCAAATFLTALHVALSDPPPPGSVLRVPLPRRDDYVLAPLPPIQTDVPRDGSPALPSMLTHGEDFAELQIPPGEHVEGITDRPASALPLHLPFPAQPPDMCVCFSCC